MSLELGFMSADPGGGFSYSGNIAKRLLETDFNVHTLRPFSYNGSSYIKAVDKKTGKYKAQRIAQNAATLRHEEWKEYDRAVVEVSRQRLRLAGDLMDAGLVYNLGDAFGTLNLFWESMSDIGAATVSKSARIMMQQDQPEVTEHNLPIPIISYGFELDARTLRASRKMGNPLDTTMVRYATRKVIEAVENMVIDGKDPDDNTIKFKNGTVYGYTTDPNVNTVTLSENWDASGKTGKEIVTEVLDLVQSSIDARHYGPWWLYVPTAYQTKLDEDYSDNKGSNTIRQRIEAIDGLGAGSVRVADFLPDDTVCLIERNAEVNQMVVGFLPRMVEWSTYGGSEALMTQYAVIAVMVPRIRGDFNNRSGNVVLS